MVFNSHMTTKIPSRTLRMAIRATVGLTSGVPNADLSEQADACEFFACMYMEKGCRVLAVRYAARANRLRALVLSRAGV